MQNLFELDWSPESRTHTVRAVLMVLALAAAIALGRWLWISARLASEVRQHTVLEQVQSVTLHKNGRDFPVTPEELARIADCLARCEYRSFRSTGRVLSPLPAGAYAFSFEDQRSQGTYLTRTFTLEPDGTLRLPVNGDYEARLSGGSDLFALLETMTAQ